MWPSREPEEILIRPWPQCAECHAETADHPLAKTHEMAFMCKKCKKAFRKEMETYEESDEFCPHCDNHYVRLSLTPLPRSAFTEDLRCTSTFHASAGH